MRPDHKRRTVVFVLPHLRTGGIEQVVKETVNRIDRHRFRPVIFLHEKTGDLLDRVAPDVPILDGRGWRAGFQPLILARQLSRLGADVVYSGTNAANVAACLAVRSLRPRIRPRHLISEHTTAEEYLGGAKASWLRRRLVRALYPGADRLIVPLPEIGEGWHATLALDGPPIRVVPNPVLTQRDITEMASQAMPRDPMLIVAAGRLVPDKGHDLLVKAFASIAQDFPAARLDIYGEGPRRAALQAQIDASGLHDRIRLKGVSSTLLSEFAKAGTVALASLREGFGNVIVEALAAGAKVVASDCAGPRHILENGRHGRLVPPGDVPALAAALRASLTEPPEHHDSAPGAQRAQHYTSARSVRIFEDTLDEVLMPARSKDEPSSAASFERH